MTVVTRSEGRSKSGKVYYFIHPGNECMNRSRRVTHDQIAKVIEKYYAPLNFYIINGCKIGANTPKNAVKEYRRICSVGDINKAVMPVLITT